MKGDGERKLKGKGNVEYKRRTGVKGKGEGTLGKGRYLEKGEGILGKGRFKEGKIVPREGKEKNREGYCIMEREGTAVLIRWTIVKGRKGKSKVLGNITQTEKIEGEIVQKEGNEGRLLSERKEDTNAHRLERERIYLNFKGRDGKGRLHEGKGKIRLTKGREQKTAPIM